MDELLLIHAKIEKTDYFIIVYRLLINVTNRSVMSFYGGKL